MIKEIKIKIEKTDKKFKEDPYHFAKNLFNQNSKVNGAPTFSAKDASDHFSKLYRDENRNYKYSPPSGLKRPKLPDFAFSDRCPTFKELKRSVKRKRNAAAPGLNSLPYVPYKKCNSILNFIHKLGIKIWKSEEIPDGWAQAYIVLLAKSDDLSDCSEFRPIAITSAASKILFSVVARRLERFLLKNNYISSVIQKGFLTGVAGCIEHAFALFEALKEAKTHKRQIVVTWIDLANAYGSVRHNLIQFALDWYHVPKKIQRLIFDYYEKLMAKIETQNWSTPFFLFDIGLFQGCVLSTILFDCVFQLLLDFLKPLDDFGYGYKTCQGVKRLARAYADDLTFMTHNSKQNQKACDQAVKWLDWTDTMAAKPRKCVTLGLKSFLKKDGNNNFISPNQNIYRLIHK